MATSIPDATLGRALALKNFGQNPIAVHRFATGSHHYVFDVAFAHQESVVVRIAGEHSRSALIGASILSRRLRPLGVPLPSIIAEDLEGQFPYMILERLPGRDLRDQITRLDDDQVADLAKTIANIQAIVSRTPSAGRYGFAVDAVDGPHEKWSQVLQEAIDRSRQRILAVKIFDPRFIDETEAALVRLQGELNRIPATPFLHDTTTRNVIITDAGMFSGIVDVDDLCFGDPRFVAALTFVALRSSNLPTNYVDKWMRNAGFSDDILFRFYVAVVALDFMSEKGQPFNANPQPDIDAQLLIQLHSEYLVATN